MIRGRKRKKRFSRASRPALHFTRRPSRRGSAIEIVGNVDDDDDTLLRESRSPRAIVRPCRIYNFYKRPLIIAFLRHREITRSRQSARARAHVRAMIELGSRWLDCEGERLGSPDRWSDEGRRGGGERRSRLLLPFRYDAKSVQLERERVRARDFCRPPFHGARSEKSPPASGIRKDLEKVLEARD